MNWIFFAGKPPGAAQTSRGIKTVGAAIPAEITSSRREILDIPSLRTAFTSRQRANIHNAERICRCRFFDDNIKSSQHSRNSHEPCGRGDKMHDVTASHWHEPKGYKNAGYGAW